MAEFLQRFFRKFRSVRRGRRLSRRGHEIDPDEVLIDSSNLPAYDTARFEGRLERPISRPALYSVLGLFCILAVTFIVQAIHMQLVNGDMYRSKAENNLLRPVPIFAGRGVIYDRNGVLLAWNAPKQNDMAKFATSTDSGEKTSATRSRIENEDAVAVREYATSTGLAHVVGYVQYPSKDSNGFYYQEDFEGVSGAEKIYDSSLKGKSGSRLVEVDARGDIVSENIVRPAEQGDSISLSIDSRVQSALFSNIRDIATRVGFSGGAGIIMNVDSGEIIALTSYPEFSSEVMSSKSDKVAVQALLNDKNMPFLDRAVDGLYTPGSIVKPYIALGALTEKVIDPAKVIYTEGFISIPNPYDKTKSTLFRDWKNLGPLDMRHAIAMSSDVYFYTIGGGFKDQKGLGIANIDKYLRFFGFGMTTLDGSESFLEHKAGTIPTPEWKKKTFNEDWFVGDTYHTAIGQYGFQVTLVQIAKAVSAIANGGRILTPRLEKDATARVESKVPVSAENFEIVRQGMRLGTQKGTSVALNVPYVEIAGKSGTAELGVSKDRVNSWITGFWPYQNPKYAFVVMLEKGSVHNLIGAAAAFRQQLDWMHTNAPEYFEL